MKATPLYQSGASTADPDRPGGWDGLSQWYGVAPMTAGYAVACAAFVAMMATGFVEPGVDARNFYDHRWPAPYSETDYSSGQGFYYSPPVALLMAPFQAFGLPLFAATMTGLGLVALYVILGRWAFLGLLFPPVWWDVVAGNVSTIMAAAIVVGIRHSGWFAVPLLLKVTPGLTVGWFLFRREWRSLAVALGVTAGIALASLLVAPHLWPQWIAGLLDNGTGYTGPGYFTVDIPVLPRLAAAMILLGWGAVTDRRWVLPVVATLAMPVLWYSCLAPLVALAARDQVPIRLTDIRAAVTLRSPPLSW